MPIRFLVAALFVLTFAGALLAQTSVKQPGKSFPSAPHSAIPGAGGGSAARTDDRIDINAATLEQLKSVPGLGDVAQKIIAGRPYRTKLDLVKRGIITRELYDKVKQRIVAHRAAAAPTPCTPATK